MISNSFNSKPLEYNKNISPKQNKVEYEKIDVVSHLLREMENVKRQLKEAELRNKNFSTFEKGWECSENDVWDSI